MELAKPRSDFTPFASIIAPCRGIDDGMHKNLEALVLQDYPEYEVIFVVDDVEDKAVEVIEKVHNRGDAETQRTEAQKKGEGDLNRLDKTPKNSSILSASRRLRGETSPSTKLVLANKAYGCSQKVENLREAVLHADTRSRVFVFVDSDTRPVAGWLRSIIAPLKDNDVGAATGYRWFISRKSTFGSEMRSVWNASIASALGPNISSNFCWGGSMAIRRDVFERIDMRKKWRGTLSDDFTVTRALNEAKLPIIFAPQALTASVEDCTFSGMLEFTTRQMKITRVYAPHLWIVSFVGSGLFNLVLITAFLIVVLNQTNSFAVWFSIATISLVSLFSIGKSWLRLRAVELVLTDYAEELCRQYWSQNTLWLFSPSVFFYNAIAACVSRRMTWRGIRYELKSANETVIIAD